MNLQEIQASRRALEHAGTPENREQLRARLVAKLRDEAEILKEQRDAVRADYRRQLSRWRTETVPADVSVCAIPADTQDSRLYRITAVFALLSEMALAAWIFHYLGVGWLFGVLTALFVTFTLHGAFLQIFRDPERPKETVHRVKTRAALPAIVGFLVALGLAMLARYVSGSLALMLLPLFSLALWSGTLSLIVLAASLFTLAHVLAWSGRDEKAYRRFDARERFSSAFLKELEEQSGPTESLPAAELLPAVPAHNRADGRGSMALPIVVFLTFTVLANTACQGAIYPNRSMIPATAVQASDQRRESASPKATLHVMIDWSGSCVRTAMEEGWETLKSEIPGIVEVHRVGTLVIWGFDDEGWCPKRVKELALPELRLPSRSELPGNEWASFANIRDAVRDAESQEWHDRKQVAREGYVKTLHEALSPLESASVLSPADHETRQTDIVGLLKRISQTREKHEQFMIVLTDLADTQHRELPQFRSRTRTSSFFCCSFQPNPRTL